MRRLVLILSLTSASLASAAEPTLQDGIALFERGEYRKAREIFSLVVTAGAAPEGREAEARVYLAAASHALAEGALAYAQLLELHRTHPDVQIDPLLFLPEFLELSARAKAEVRREQEAAAMARAQVEAPEVVEVEQQVEPPSEDVTGLSLHVGGRAFADVAGTRSVGAVADVLAGYGSLEGGLRVVVGHSPAPGLELAWAPYLGMVRPRLGARVTALPGAGGVGTGAFAGVRLPVSAAMSVVADAGVERFFGLDDRYQDLAITVTAGVAYDVFGGQTR